jgi:hypothetical protein
MSKIANNINMHIVVALILKMYVVLDIGTALYGKIIANRLLDLVQNKSIQLPFKAILS